MGEIDDTLLFLEHPPVLTMGEIDDTLLFLEHPPVLTMGWRSNSVHILLSRPDLDRMGVKIYEVNRGGDVTYHGPGQIVGYSIIDLNGHGRDIRVFVRKLEEVFIFLLKQEYAIFARSDEKTYTGVWVGDQKITAIGIALKNNGLEEYFVAVAKSILADFPIYVYNIPQRSVNDLKPEVIERIIWRAPNIIGMKYSFADLVRAAEYIGINNGNFSVLMVEDRLFTEFLTMGCDGVVYGSGNVCPEPLVALYKAYRDEAR
jgi:lipoate-protein ligase B